MLARTYLTAEQLHLDQITYDGLIQIMYDLRDGTLKHVSIDTNIFNVVPRSRDLDFGSNAFNMCWYDCGTAHCIGGWLAVRGQLASGWRREGPQFRRLRELFNPRSVYHCNMSYDNLTAEQAADAIERMLMDQHPYWVQK